MIAGEFARRLRLDNRIADLAQGRPLAAAGCSLISGCPLPLSGQSEEETDPLSVAFVKEESAEAASETILPARPISDRINLVTEAGLQRLQDDLAKAREAFEAADALEDVNQRRRQSALPVRDMRYFAERVRTAQLSPPPASNDVIAFGHTVTFERDDGRRQSFRIVGEDEADPSRGSISHGSPVALALLGKSVGDVVQLGDRELEILAIA